MKALKLAGIFLGLAFLVITAGTADAAGPVGTVFTYQGQLTLSGIPVNNTCDFQFSLFDAATAGAQVGTIESKSIVNVTNGLFTVSLDFGTSSFNGDARYLDIGTRCPAGTGGFTTLTPRQALTATPYAVFASSVGTLSSLTVSGGTNLATTSGNVGVGTTSPGDKLHVVGNIVLDSGVLSPVGGQDLKLIMKSPNGIVFSDNNLGEKMRITSTGNVGIGTTIPAVRLDIKNSLANLDAIRVTQAGGDRFRHIFAVNESLAGDGSLFLAKGVGGLVQVFLNANGSSFFTGGNVGIGATSPAAKLHVEGSSTETTEPQLRIFNPTAGTGQTAGIRMHTAGGWDIQLRTNQDKAWLELTDFAGAVQSRWFGADYFPGTDNSGTLGRTSNRWNALRVGTGVSSFEGNVGIGTASPTQKLDVAGTVKATNFSGDGSALTGVAAATVADSSVTSAKIVNGAIVNADLNVGSFPNIVRVGTLNSLSVSGNVSLATAPNCGSFILIFSVPCKVGIGTASPSSKLHVVGTITGTTKDFEIDHPTQSGMKLVHSSLEGPEVAVFYRGTGQLAKGKAVIQLPDYFEALTRKEGRTVQVTPKFDGDEPISALAASGAEDGKFTVRAVDDKNPEQKFYWEVKAVRADVAPLVVEKQVVNDQQTQQQAVMHQTSNSP